jgi:hypothetical protein
LLASTIVKKGELHAPLYALCQREYSRTTLASLCIFGCEDESNGQERIAGEAGLIATSILSASDGLKDSYGRRDLLRGAAADGSGHHRMCALSNNGNFTASLAARVLVSTREGLWSRRDVV